MNPLSHSRFASLSIRRKLVLILMLTSCAALILACVAFVVNDLATYRQTLSQGLSTQAEVIGNSSAAALTFNDPKPVEEILTALSADPNLISASVYDKAGGILAQYVRRDRRANFTPLKVENAGFRFEAHALVLFHEIRYEGQRLGFVGLQKDLQEMRTRLRRYAGIVVAVLLTSVGVAFLLSSLLQRFISRPIQDLAHTARLVTEKKDYSIRVQQHSQDELGLLIKAFNGMLEQIKSFQTGSPQYKELEARIANP